MSPNTTPLSTVNEEHGGKEKLVDRIMGLIERGEEEQAELKKRLLAASNRKLLRLSTTLETIRARFGSKDKLAATVADLMGKARDSDYVRKLESFTPGRLLDLARSLARRAGRAGVAGAEPEPDAAAPKASAKPKTKAKPKEAAPAAKKASKPARSSKAAKGEAAKRKKPAAAKPRKRSE